MSRFLQQRDTFWPHCNVSKFWTHPVFGDLSGAFKHPVWTVIWHSMRCCFYFRGKGPSLLLIFLWKSRMFVHNKASYVLWPMKVYESPPPSAIKCHLAFRRVAWDLLRTGANMAKYNFTSCCISWGGTRTHFGEGGGHGGLLHTQVLGAGMRLFAIIEVSCSA